MSAEDITVLTSTFPERPGDPRGGFIFAYWSQRAVGPGARRVRVLAPRNRTTDAAADFAPLRVERLAYAPRRLAGLCGSFGILENLRVRPQRALALPGLWLSARKALHRAFERGTQEVAVHMLLPFGLPAARECHRAGVPVSVFGHGTDIDVLAYLPKDLRRLCGEILRDCETVWVASQAKSARLQALVGPLENVHVESMVAQVLTPVVGERRPRPGTTTTRILFLGRLIRQKGVDVLLQALALHPPELRKRYRVQIAGDGPERARLIRLAKRLELDRLEFRGFVGEEQRALLLRESDLMVVPSRPVGRLSEGAPLVIVEGRRAGLPVIASAVGGIPELSHGDSEVVLVPPGDPQQLARAIAAQVRRHAPYTARASNGSERSSR